MKKVLTAEQKQRRAETARRNGAKSKGPVTIEGKHRSSMNAITVGKYVDVHDEEVPAFAPILTVEDRKAYVRLHQANLRQYRPQSENEHNIVRHITAAQFEHERFCTLERLQLQSEYDCITRECQNVPNEQKGHFAMRHSVNNDKIHRLIERKRKALLAAWTKLVALFEKVRKAFPMTPPEPVDITADSAVLNEPEPPQYVVEEMLKLADRAKKEPNFPLPDCVVYLLYDEELMKKFAPNYDARELRKRYPNPDSKRAA